MEREYSCCFTGYRPQKFSFALGENNAQNAEFERQLYTAVSELAESGVTVFYCGMAIGFDIIAAEAVLDIMALRPELCLRLVACVPFIEQSKTFSPSWKKRYDAVLQKADKTVLISDKYFKGCYQRRNEYMVKSCDVVLTCFDGKSGGTKNTIDYARKLGRKVININESTDC